MNIRLGLLGMFCAISLSGSAMAATCYQTVPAPRPVTCSGMKSTGSGDFVGACTRGTLSYITVAVQCATPPGGLCGMATSGSNLRDPYPTYCQGYNPLYNCPAGYTKTLVTEADKVFTYSCVAN